MNILNKHGYEATEVAHLVLEQKLKNGTPALDGKCESIVLSSILYKTVDKRMLLLLDSWIVDACIRLH